MLAIDPTEAIRSSEIPEVLRRHFDVIEERRLGGALVHIALGDIAQNFDPDDPEARSALERLLRWRTRRWRTAGSAPTSPPSPPCRNAKRSAPRSGGSPGGGHRPPAAPPPAARTAEAPPSSAQACDTAEQEAPFDEAWYLDAYPDVRDAVAAGVFESGRDHWTQFGEVEERLPSARPPTAAERAAFDEAWYLDTYPDVRAAVASGAFESGRDHWLQFGEVEGRLPSDGSRPAD
jgi:hypothetical protein